MKQEKIPELVKSGEHDHDHKYVALWMPVIAFILICISYIYCHVTELQTNLWRETAAVGISGIFAAICLYKMK